MGNVKKKIALFSTSRAEFGLVNNLYRELKKKKFKVFLFVGGAHLSKTYGNTISEIKNSKIKIDDFFYYAPKKNDHISISKSIGISNIELAKIFNKHNFDNIIAFGDRFDLIPIITNGLIYNKKIIHISGGEKTIGAIDNKIRNMVSKSSDIHFTSCNKYKNNLVKLGVKKKVIFNVGTLSFDKNFILNQTKNEIIKKYKLNKDIPIVSFTYHPTEVEDNIKIEKKLNQIFKALNMFKLNLIINSPNLEVNSNKVVKILKKKVRQNKHYRFFKSLGFKNYHNLLKHSDFIIGNSSSGIIEAPYYKTPSINIGNRQKGRIRHQSIVDVNYDYEKIILSIKKVMSLKFKSKIKNLRYKFGNGNTSQKIAKILNNIL